jgi:hypothetical protein
MDLSNMTCVYCGAVYSIKMKGHGSKREPGFVMAIVPVAHARGTYYDGKAYTTCPFCFQPLAPQWWDRELQVWKSCTTGPGFPAVIESKPIRA